MQNLQDIIELLRDKQNTLQKVKEMINGDYDNEDIVEYINKHLK